MVIISIAIFTKTNFTRLKCYEFGNFRQNCLAATPSRVRLRPNLRAAEARRPS
jgi:hypothetical protein